MIYLGIVAVLVAILAGTGVKLYAAGESAGRAALQAKLDAADKQLADKADALQQEAANHITDMEAAWDASEAVAKAHVVVVRAKGASDVRSYPVFANPACVLPVDVVQSINGARASFRNAADPGESVGAVRDTAAAPNGNASGRCTNRCWRTQTFGEGALEARIC
jgi:Sec-independent protein translocase protein TatA